MKCNDCENWKIDRKCDECEELSWECFKDQDCTKAYEKDHKCHHEKQLQ
jgi:hypothetical protein